MIWLQKMIWLHANNKCTGQPRGGSRVSGKGYILCIKVCGGSFADFYLFSSHRDQIISFSWDI